VICYDLAWRIALFLQKLAYQSDRSALVALALDQDVKDFTLGIDRAPQVHPASIDTNVHFIQMPGGMGPWSAPAKDLGESRSEPFDPTSDCLVAHLDTTFG
jgi:hypothetical protein